MACTFIIVAAVYCAYVFLSKDNPRTAYAPQEDIQSQEVSTEVRQEKNDEPLVHLLEVASISSDVPYYRIFAGEIWQLRLGGDGFERLTNTGGRVRDFVVTNSSSTIIVSLIDGQDYGEEIGEVSTGLYVYDTITHEIFTLIEPLPRNAVEEKYREYRNAYDEAPFTYRIDIYGLIFSPEKNNIYYSQNKEIKRYSLDTRQIETVFDYLGGKFFCSSFVPMRLLVEERFLEVGVGCYEGGFGMIIDLEKKQIVYTGKHRYVTNSGKYFGPLIGTSNIIDITYSPELCPDCDLTTTTATISFVDLETATTTGQMYKFLVEGEIVYDDRTGYLRISQKDGIHTYSVTSDLQLIDIGINPPVAESSMIVGEVQIDKTKAIIPNKQYVLYGDAAVNNSHYIALVLYSPDEEVFIREYFLGGRVLEQTFSL